MVPGSRNCLFVNGALCLAKIRGFRRRDICLRAVQTDVALALLLRVVERMGVQKGPDKLPADIFEAKLEMSVLIDGVMSAEKRSGTDIDALLFGDFFRMDQPGA